MISVYCFSGSGHSLAVAKVLAGMLECKIRQIEPDCEIVVEETVAVVFPVYCQNIPNPVKNFLRQLKAKYIVLIATYGKISYGNVLYEAQRLVQGDVIAGAYIPMGHTFLSENYIFDESKLLPIAERVKAPQKVSIPRTRKNLLANILPAARSRIGVKLIKDGPCSNCGLCEKMCPAGAIRNGRIHAECIRCLRCVTNCPKEALRYKNSWILNRYLKSFHKEEYVLYL